jgi:DNA-binding CsgD family transcriptional regulator
MARKGNAPRRSQRPGRRSDTRQSARRQESGPRADSRRTRREAAAVPEGGESIEGDAHSLARAVGAASDHWRQIEAEQERTWAEIAVLPPDDAKRFVAGMLLALGEEYGRLVRDLWERYRVHVSFVIEGGKLRWQVGLPPDMTLSEDDARTYASSIASILCGGHVVWSAKKAMEPDWDTERVLAAIRQAFTEGPIVLAGLAQSNASLAPLADQREAANIMSAGWADTRILLTGRLAKALSIMRLQPRKAKPAELPASTYMAWSERDAREPLTGRGSTVARIASNLEELGGKTAETVEFPEDYPSLAEDFAAHEDARTQLDELRAVANLSPQEAQVLDLQMEGFKDEEIAEQLGRKVGSVWSVTSRIKAKLLKAQLSL